MISSCRYFFLLYLHQRRNHAQLLLQEQEEGIPILFEIFFKGQNKTKMSIEIRKNPALSRIFSIGFIFYGEWMIN